jgi:hypothetical protein
MKRTLLEIVQNILNDLDSDEVNSISDTTESQQVAEIVKQAYFDIISNRNWAHLSGLFQFPSAIDTERPTHINMPENIKEVEFIKYDKRKEATDSMLIRDIDYVLPHEFLTRTYSRNSNNSNIKTVDNGDGTVLLIQSDKAPEFWTSFDDKALVFDSYNSKIESTIQNTKLSIKAFVHPVWNSTDDFVPDLPAEAFSNLVAEAKSNAFLTLKQVANDKAEMTAQRQSRWLSRKDWSAHGGVNYASYGRRGRGKYTDPTFK